jgi:hypothetical protein
MSDSFQDNLHAGNVPSEDAEPKEILEDAPPAQITRWLEIFFQLNNSKRFRAFVNSNYTIQDEINERDRTITTMVIEKPDAVGPPLAARQLIAIGKLLVVSGVKTEDASETIMAFMRILANSPEADITLSTDVTKALEEAKMAKKFQS